MVKQRITIEIESEKPYDLNEDKGDHYYPALRMFFEDNDIKVSLLEIQTLDAAVLGYDSEDSVTPGAPIYRRNPVPDGCEDCAGCPDCLTSHHP